MSPFVINYGKDNKDLINLDKVIYVEYCKKTDGTEIITFHYETEWQIEEEAYCHHENTYEEHITTSTKTLYYSDGATGLKTFNNIVSCMDQQNRFNDALLEKLDMLINKIK